MSYRKILFSITLLFLLAPFAKADESFVFPDRYLLTFKNSPSKPRLIRFAGERRRRKRFHRYYNKCGKLRRQNPQIKQCAPDFEVRIAGQDPFVFACQNPTECLWPADNQNDTDLNLPEAWSVTEGNPQLVVAVLDTGLDLTHPDISQNIWINDDEVAGNQVDDDANGYIDDVSGFNAFAPGQPPQDDHGHGTHVSGIIAAARGNNIGIAGAAPLIKILPVKMLSSNGSGSISSAIAGIDYLIALHDSRPVNLVAFNNSWGSQISDSAARQLLTDAFKRAEDAGILAVTAAGNEAINLDLQESISSRQKYVPAQIDIPGLITVAATGFDGRLASYSNYGGLVVDLAAPGTDVRSLLASGVQFGRDAQDGTCLASGTSMAAPYVTAALALIKSRYPELSFLELRDHLLSRIYALDQQDAAKVISGGRLNMLYVLTDDDIPEPTPLPTLVPTLTPVPTETPEVKPVLPTPGMPASPTPESTSTPAPQDADLETGFPPAINLSVRPVGTSAEGEGNNIISLKGTNILRITATKAIRDTLSVQISDKSCLLKTFNISSLPFSALFKLKKGARKIQGLNFSVQGPLTVSQQTFSVPLNKAGHKKRKAKRISCKTLKKSFVLIAG